MTGFRVWLGYRLGAAVYRCAGAGLTVCERIAGPGLAAYQAECEVARELEVVV